MRYPRRRGGPGIRYLVGRREFLWLAGGAGAALLWPFARPASARAAALPAATRAALETSPYVYVSPLKADGSESRCHGEVWFGWIDGAVVVNTSPERWKTTAIRRGLDRARIWVGDHGRWKQMVGKSDAFRAAPSFDARGEVATETGLIDRLLSQYDSKYPDEIGVWRDKMKNGVADGSRVLIRYSPL
jgi:hypothetical protein